MYQYHEKVPFFVYVIESPSAEDVFNNCSEGEMLKKTLSFYNFDCILRTATTKGIFVKALEEDIFYEINKRENVQLIIHISAHGNNEGLGATNNEHISWADIAELLEPINKKMSNGLLLCLSACQSSSACAMGLSNKNPFLGMVANKDKPTWPETATAYTCFYHLFSKGVAPRDAVETMCKASGNEHFVFATIGEIRKVEEQFLNKN